ncbi:MAG TPA: hypothetical protein VF487_18895 [Chitinophagaceae bacterium]
MSIHDYPSWELKPRKLSQAETNDPLQVIHSFYDYAHLPQVRELLWKWLKATVTGTFNSGLTRRERDSLTHFFEHLEKLIEATHIIHQQKNNK